MKKAVSISLGSSTRDKEVEIEILGQKVRIERRGADGDIDRAVRLFSELDGKVDAFGLGGATLCLSAGAKKYALRSAKALIRDVKKTPVVDGTGLKDTLEKQFAPLLDSSPETRPRRRRVLLMSAADRWGMTSSFVEAGYEYVFGDLMFALGVPVSLRSERALQRAARILLPLISFMPFSWIYPTGEKQEVRTPKFREFFEWADVIAGDCHYIKRFMPDSLDGKIIVTNTTTQEDLILFRDSGARFVLTSTPPFAGRTYGTNMIEAAMVAASGKNRPLSMNEIAVMLDKMALKPHLHRMTEMEVQPEACLGNEPAMPMANVAI